MNATTMKLFEMNETSMITQQKRSDGRWFSQRDLRQSLNRRAAFTLVELMIAMTVTLLLMAALGQAFGMIGRTMKEGRSQVELSSKLRGLSFRMRTDLRNVTVKAQPPVSADAGKGYFMMYEGPLTESTFAMFGAEPTQTTSDGLIVRDGHPRWNAEGNTPTYRAHSRIGDCDDYLAFTAEAAGDDWFTGKVPAYLVDDVLAATDPMAPVTIRSKYAEIITWAAPRWTVNDNNNLDIAPHPSGMPRYLDAENGTGDLVPDNIVLHQRILLIRPDLNVLGKIYQGTANEFDGKYLRTLGGVGNPDNVPNPLLKVYPIAPPPLPAPAVPRGLYPYVAAGSATDNAQMLESNWLVGMAGVHHFFDISLRRVVHPRTGVPTEFVAANSLEDLTKPHNRFAHVRYPGRYFGRGPFAGPDNATSMPLLALGWNDSILNWQGTNDPRIDPENPPTGTPGWFPTSHASPTTLNAVSGSRSGLFNGWLLPHFELGDPNPPDPATASHWQRDYLSVADSRWDRTGEDIITGNILAFDLKAYDAQAPLFVTAGPDGEPGRAGVNDDNYPTTGANTTDQSVIQTGLAPFPNIVRTELGMVGSDDVVIRTHDLGMFDLLENAVTDPTNAGLPFGHQQGLAGRGDFVDLFYPYLAGTPAQDQMGESSWQTTPAMAAGNAAAVTQAAITSNYNNFLRSAFSGSQIPWWQMDSLKRSGKLVHSNNAGGICFFQPTYDTWTTAYESDGFDQTHTATGALTAAGDVTDPYVGTTWVLNDVIAGNQMVPLIPATVNQLQIDTGLSIETQPETAPPIASELSAIQVTIRMNDPGSHEMTQFTIVEGMQ